MIFEFININAKNFEKLSNLKLYKIWILIIVVDIKIFTEILLIMSLTRFKNAEIYWNRYLNIYKISKLINI